MRVKAARHEINGGLRTEPRVRPIGQRMQSKGLSGIGAYVHMRLDGALMVEAEAGETVRTPQPPTELYGGSRDRRDPRSSRHQPEAVQFGVDAVLSPRISWVQIPPLAFTVTRPNTDKPVAPVDLGRIFADATQNANVSWEGTAQSPISKMGMSLRQRKPNLKQRSEVPIHGAVRSSAVVVVGLPCLSVRTH